MSSRPIVAITIGDINGIGPEVILKALSRKEIRELCRPIIIAPKTILIQQLKFLEVDFTFKEISELEDKPISDTDIEVMVPELGEKVVFEPGKITATSGRIAGRALELATELALHKKVDAIITAPISKTAFYMAGYNYPGHTEFFAEKTRAKDFVMVLLRGKFRVGLVTTHCPISRVAPMLSRELILNKLEILNNDLLERFKITNPKIAVTALNPHGGECGLFGTEEQDTIIPAVKSAQELGIKAEGPFPADTLFAQLGDQKFDAYLAMYHDQGLIPLKMKSFGQAVNYTAGLPIIRTSPDHGTAFDIAGKGVADPGSMMEAVKLAVAMASKIEGC